jgi:hypothetical protein
MSGGFSRSYDDWKSTEPEHDGGGSSRLAQERAWWQEFRRARAARELEQFFEEYDGLSMYVVLCEDARRILEADERAYVDAVDSGTGGGDSVTLRRDR